MCNHNSTVPTLGKNELCIDCGACVQKEAK